MAGHIRKTTRSRRDQRRSHDAAILPTLSVERLDGSIRRRHHVSKDGLYRGRRIFAVKTPKAPEHDHDHHTHEH